MTKIFLFLFFHLP